MFYFILDLLNWSLANIASYRSTLRKFACQAADHALRFLLGHHVQDSISDVFSSCKVHSVKYSAFRWLFFRVWIFYVLLSTFLQWWSWFNHIYSAYYRIPLCAPPTMTTVDCNNTSFYREGFILSLSLEDGNVGFGEVSVGLMSLLVHVPVYNLVEWCTWCLPDFHLSHLPIFFVSPL